MKTHVLAVPPYIDDMIPSGLTDREYLYLALLLLDQAGLTLETQQEIDNVLRRSGDLERLGIEE